MKSTASTEQLSFDLNTDESPEVRDFNGYFQYREQYDKPTVTEDGAVSYKQKFKWVFYVTGFDPFGQEGFCHVLMSDRTKTVVPIDKKGRITINGKKYSRDYWNH